jgi:hypothetical protein
MKKLFTLFFIILLGLYTQAQDIETGLILRLSFCGNMNDASTFENNGVYMGSANPSYTTDHMGNQNAALHLNGFSDWVRVPASESINEPLDAITVACWAKYESLAWGQWAPIMAKTNTLEVLDRQYSMGLNGLEGKIYMMDTYVGETDLNPNEWYHFAITYTPELYQCYVNGELIGEVVPVSPVTGNDKDLEIGRDTPDATDYFHGTLDEINVYNRVLSAADIMALKNHDGCDYSSLHDQKLSESFQISPNPATDEITLQLPDNDSYQVSIMDMQGRLIQLLQNQQQKVNTNISHLESGLYVIKIQSSTGYAVEKLLVK